MKIILLLLLVAIAAVWAITPYPETASTSAIKVWSSGRDIRNVLDHLSNQLRSTGISFEVTESESEADLSVHFQDDIGDSSAAGMAYPLLGNIYIVNSLPSNELYVVLIHEFLHCAGVGHEADDPSSVMYTSSQSRGRVKRHHIELLRSLAGKTMFGRVRAQIGLVGGSFACTLRNEAWSCEGRN